MQHLQVDVVIVGAGFSGLSAAASLLREGLSIAVLEAGPRVGGRCEAVRLEPGLTVDAGGMWTSLGQHRLQTLAAAFDVPLFTPLADGRDLMFLAGEPIGDPGAIHQQVARVAAELDELSLRLPNEPWRFAAARSWEGILAGQWLDEHIGDRMVRALAELVVDGWFRFPSGQMSLLHLAHMVRLKGGAAALFGLKDSHLFLGGVGSLAARIAETLNGSVVTGQPVGLLRTAGGAVEVESPAVRVRATHAVLAMAPAVSAQIQYEPGLPAWRRRICQRAPMGQASKVMVVYPEPFWRAKGCSGTVVDDGGPIVFTRDVSIPDSPYGVLCGYMSSWHSTRLEERSPQDRMDAALACIERWFGAAAQNPLHFIERRYGDDPHIGGHQTVFVPGFWVDEGTNLRRPVGPLHWAGTELADSFPGEIEGAVDSGFRAAEEVLAGI